MTLRRRVRSDEEIGAKWDRCLSNTLVYTSVGLGFGILLSAALLRSACHPQESYNHVECMQNRMHVDE